MYENIWYYEYKCEFKYYKLLLSEKNNLVISVKRLIKIVHLLKLILQKKLFSCTTSWTRSIMFTICRSRTRLPLRILHPARGKFLFLKIICNFQSRQKIPLLWLVLCLIWESFPRRYETKHHYVTHIISWIAKLRVGAVNAIQNAEYTVALIEL